MIEEHSADFWDERQKSLERAAEEHAQKPAPVLPEPTIIFESREAVLDFIRQHSI